MTWKVRQSAAGSSTRVPGLHAYGFAGGNSPCDSTGWDAAAASSLPDNGQLHLEAVHGHRGASRGWPQDPDKPRRVQQVHLLPCGNLVDSLEMEYNPGTEIKPQPPEMKMSAMDLVPCADKDEEAKPEAFMAEMCELVPLKEASLGSRFAVEGQPPVAGLSSLVQEWGAELTIAEWKLQEEASARKKLAARKVPAGRRGKTNFCKGLPHQRSWAAQSGGAANKGACCAARSPGGCGNLTRVLKALQAHERNPDIFEAACDRLALWLGAEEAEELRAKSAAPRAPPTQTRAAAREERLSAAQASFTPALAKRKTNGPAPTRAAWQAYRAKAVAEQRLGKKKFYPKAPRRPRATQAEIAAGAEADNAPDLPAASHSLPRVNRPAEVVSARGVGHVPQLQHLAGPALDFHIL